MRSMGDLLISELAERCGVPATTLRFYESAGLLPAGRTPAGYRVYGEDAVHRLRFIAAAKRLGLPLDEIAGLLRVWAGGSCAQVRDGLRPALAARIADAERRAAELAAFTAMLHRAAEHLQALPDRDGSCDDVCFIPAHLPDAEVACSLDGPAMGDRIRDWRDLVRDADRQVIPGGLRLSMPIGRAAQVAELSAAEQRCCPFLGFSIHLTGQRLHLEVRVPAEAEGMLTDLFG